MADFAPVGGTNMLDFGMPSTTSNLGLIGGGGTGLSSGNTFTFAQSDVVNPPVVTAQPPSYTQPAINPSAFHTDPAGNSDFGASAQVTAPLFLAPDYTDTLVTNPAGIGAFTDWAFGISGGN
jgi:hypothetical protein